MSRSVIGSAGPPGGGSKQPPKSRCVAQDEARLEEVGEVDVVFDVIGGEVLERSAPLVRAGGTLVTIVGPPKVRPADVRVIFFVVEPDRFGLADLAERVRSGRLKPIIGAVRPLAEAPSAFAPNHRASGKTIIRVTKGG